MKTNYLYCLLFCSLFFLSNSCKKEDPLPAATGEGKNIFACYVNGEVWKPYSEDFKAHTLQADYTQTDRKLNVFAYRRVKGTFEQMRFVIQDFPLQTGTYLLNGNDSYGEYIRLEPGPHSEYSTDSQYTGKVVITKIDKSQRIITGSFSFVARLNNSPETVTITDGRFDLIYGLY